MNRGTLEKVDKALLVQPGIQIEGCQSMARQLFETFGTKSEGQPMVKFLRFEEHRTRQGKGLCLTLGVEDYPGTFGSGVVPGTMLELVAPKPMPMNGIYCSSSAFSHSLTVLLCYWRGTSHRG